MEKLSVIVPCFNEQETLQDYYDAISKVRETLLGKECELQVILVDDGSKDKTLAKMKELSGSVPGSVIFPLPEILEKKRLFMQG